jgi:methyl-accepting chemotaxis protein
MANLVAFGGVIKDIGLRVETAGTQLSNLFSKLVAEPAKFAKIVGLSTKEFRQRIETDAVGAIVLWLEALNKLKGESEIQAIREIQLRGMRATNVITLLAQNVDYLRQVLKMADDEAERGTSLNRQWDIINQSVAASLNKVTNQGRVLAIEMGRNIFPILEVGIGVLRKFLGFLESAPDVLKNFVMSLGLILALAGPLGLMFGNTLKLIEGMVLAIKAAVVATTAMNAALAGTGLVMHASLANWLAMVGPVKVVMLVFIALLAGFATYMAFFADRTGGAQIKLQQFRRELADTIEQQIKYYERAQKLAKTIADLGQSAESAKRPIAENKELFKDINDTFPGLISNTDTFGEAIKKMGKKADEAGGKITELNETLAELQTTEVGDKLIEVQDKISKFEKAIADALAGGVKYLARSGWDRDMIAVLRSQYKDILAQPGLLGAEDFVTRFLGIDEGALQKADFRERLRNLIITLTTIIKKGFPKGAPEDLMNLRNFFVEFQKNIHGLSTEKDNLEGLEKIFEKLTAPKGKPTEIYDPEAEGARLAALKKQLEYVESLIEGAREQVRLAKERGQVKTEEEQEDLYKGIIISQSQAIGGIKAGIPVAKAYEQTMRETVDQLALIIKNTKDVEKAYEYAAERTKLLTELSQKLNRVWHERREPRNIDEELRIQVRLLDLREKRYRNALAIADREGRLVEFLENERDELDSINALRVRLLEATKAQVNALLGVKDFEMLGPEKLATILKTLPVDKVAIIRDNLTQIHNLIGKMSQPRTATEQLRIQVRLLDLQEEQYRNAEAVAEREGRIAEFLKDHRGELDAINTLRSKLLETTKAQVNALLGVKDFEMLGPEKLAEVLKSLSDEKVQAALDKLTQIIKLTSRLEAKKVLTPGEEFARTWEEMGLKAKNAFDHITSNFRRMNSRLVDMLFDAKLKMRDIWEGMAKDAIILFLEEIEKELFVKGIARFVKTLFGGGLKAGAEIPGPSMERDFLVRKDGTVVHFDPGDSILGFKSLAGLMSMIPAIQGPQFATVGSPSVNVAPPNVAVNVPQPKVEVHLRQLRRGQRFVVEEQKDLATWNRVRRLSNS